MATPNYSKIWGANSPLAKYEFTEADYLRGWEFIGSMPPARTMFDAWMRKADEKMRWLYDNAFSENSLGGFLFWRLPDTAYFVGEKRALQDGPLDVYIECTIAGRTSKEQMKNLPQGAEIGKTFVDGTATWLVRQFATSAALDDHRKKTPLDHPDGSVLKRHLGFEVYGKNEIDQSYRKIGDRTAYGIFDWDDLIEPTTYEIKNAQIMYGNHAPPEAEPAGEYLLNGFLIVHCLEEDANDENNIVQIYYSYAKNNLWTRMRKDGDWNAWTPTITPNTIQFFVGEKVNKSGDTMTGNLTVPSIYANNWFRARGDCGLYFEDHGGGWHMTDNDWIRAYNGKNIYTSGKVRCDAGFEGNLRGTADNANVAQNIANDSANMRMHWNGQGGQPAWLWGGNDPYNMYVWNPSDFRVANANTVGDRSLQWILEQINAAKTGIVAGNLEQNGWVKFANGLIVQWTRCTESKNETDFRYFPMKFPKTLFYICASSTHANNWLGVSWTRKVDNEKFVCGLGHDYEVDNAANMFILAFGA